MRLEMSFKQNGGSSAAIYVVRFSFPLSLHPLRGPKLSDNTNLRRGKLRLNMLHST